MSLPVFPSTLSSSYSSPMGIARRKTLPHEIPSWVDPQKEIYFVTINCEERFRNQLALPDVSRRLFETVRHRQEEFLWWPYLFLLMPDHLHALLFFPPSVRQVGERARPGRGFPRPGRKTPNGSKDSDASPGHRTSDSWTRGASSNARGGRAPKFGF